MAFCGWRIDGFCCGWRIDGAFCGCFYDELLRGGGVRLVEMCCDSCEVAPRGLTGRRQRCGLDEKRSERPTSCMDHRGSRHRRVDFVALVCVSLSLLAVANFAPHSPAKVDDYRRADARSVMRGRTLWLVAQGHNVACCKLEDLRTAAVRGAADRSTAPTTWGHEGTAAHKTSSETPPRTKRAARRHDGGRRSHDRNRVHEARR